MVSREDWLTLQRKANQTVLYKEGKGSATVQKSKRSTEASDIRVGPAIRSGLGSVSLQDGHGLAGHRSDGAQAPWCYDVSMAICVRDGLPLLR